MQPNINWDKPLQYATYGNKGEIFWHDARLVGELKHATHTKVVAYTKANGDERVVTLERDNPRGLRNKAEKKKVNVIVYDVCGTVVSCVTNLSRKEWVAKFGKQNPVYHYQTIEVDV